MKTLEKAFYILFCLALLIIGIIGLVTGEEITGGAACIGIACLIERLILKDNEQDT